MKILQQTIKSVVLAMLALLTVLPIQAQNVGDAIYIYRNDGDFNAFYREEIDSMAYSYYDADSVRYEEIVTQLIYTADSLYRIPIAAIDSVSFVEPVNEYQPNVVKIDALIPYVESVDGLKLCLSSDVPSDLLPRKGDVIIYESFENEFFPTGYAGKVQEVQPSSILCDSVNIGDIYKNYVSFGCFLAVADDDGTDEVPNTRLVPRIGGTVSPHFFAERTFPLNYDYLTGSITLR